MVGNVTVHYSVKCAFKATQRLHVNPLMTKMVSMEKSLHVKCMQEVISNELDEWVQTTITSKTLNYTCFALWVPVRAYIVLTWCATYLSADALYTTGSQD